MSPSPLPPDPPALSADPLEDSDYDSANDSDFDPSAAPAADDDGALSDTSSTTSPRPKRKRTFSSPTSTPAIKTRSQRARVSPTRTGGVSTGPVTTNVDELWAQMSATPVVRTPAFVVAAATPPSTSTSTPPPAAEVEPEKEVLSATGEKMVTIQHTYEFAGKTITESKLVAASSMTARAHLGSAGSTPAATPPPEGAPKRRAPPKKRASAFDSAAAARAKPVVATKLNTLEKSRLDWAGFVDNEGIGDELQKWNKGDKGYLDRQAFLGRVEQRRDDTWKEGVKKA